MDQPAPTIVSEQDQITAQCRAEYDAGLKYRHDREKPWQLIEDFYFNRVKKSLKGKFNVPVPIIPGFVDTWQSKMAKHVNLTYEQGVDEADFRAAKKATAFYQKIKSHDDYDYDMLDTDGKKIGGLYGVVPYKYYAQSNGGYKSTLDLIDPYDHIVDPVGGGFLERHRFVQQDNVFRSKDELKDGGEQGVYDSSQVSKIINVTRADKLLDNDTQFKSKQNRLMALGLDGITYNYAGQDLYKFIEAGTTWKGKRYYVVFNYETGIWIRCQPLKEVFKSDLWPWVSWHTNRDIFNYWSKSPCDDMIPLAEVIRVLVNQELDNRNKRNYGMRGYDPAIIPDPSQLEWRQDGLVAFKSGSAQLLGDMKKGTVEFETAELTGTINLVEYIDGMLKEKTGVNSEAQGGADTSKVGIAYLNIQQSGERTRLVYESYTKCWQAIGRRFLWGLTEHLRSAEAVKIIGEKGAEWDELSRMEVNPEWDVQVSGGEDETNKDEIKKKALVTVLESFQLDELAVTNPKWRAQIKLQSVEIDDDEIRMAFDLQDEGNREVLSKASQMIQDCLAGKPWKPFRGANTAFCQKIQDYADNADDLKQADYLMLAKMVQVHLPIAAENAARKAVQMRAQAGVAPIPSPSQPGQGPTLPQLGPPGGTPGGTASQSQQLTQLAPAPTAVPTP